ncbi:MAG: hypothetical protein HY288_12940 [Planctomycetia bacterium]|nr:hypothetical protein [Planctomycetia bacterium]
MTRGAYVGSIRAVRDFRAALVTFAQEAREAIGSYEMEVRRTLDWLLEAQPQYWKLEVRKCEDRVTEAKIELERRRNSKLPGGETPSCMEERKALERARARRQYAEEKVESVRKWGYVAQREEVEYAGRANQFGGTLDVDLPQAIATLDRVLTTLESYLAISDPGGERPLTTPAAPVPRPAARPIAPDTVAESPHGATIDKPAAPRSSDP